MKVCASETRKVHRLLSKEGLSSSPKGIEIEFLRERRSP